MLYIFFALSVAVLFNSVFKNSEHVFHSVALLCWVKHFEASASRSTCTYLERAVEKGQLAAKGEKKTEMEMERERECETSFIVCQLIHGKNCMCSVVFARFARLHNIHCTMKAAQQHDANCAAFMCVCGTINCPWNIKPNSLEVIERKEIML